MIGPSMQLDMYWTTGGRAGCTVRATAAAVEPGAVRRARGAHSVRATATAAAAAAVGHGGGGDILWVGTRQSHNML